MMKRDEQGQDERELSDRPQKIFARENPAHNIKTLDAETMKDKFTKLLLGDDITRGRKGVSTALSLSNAITNLTESYGLEPLSKERKNRWRREMKCLLSPTNFMIELVPTKQHGVDGHTKQHGVDGHTMEIMTPKAQADIHMNLPAPQKLDSMLIPYNCYIEASPYTPNLAGLFMKSGDLNRDLHCYKYSVFSIQVPQVIREIQIIKLQGTEGVTRFTYVPLTVNGNPVDSGSLIRDMTGNYQGTHPQDEPQGDGNNTTSPDANIRIGAMF